MCVNYLASMLLFRYFTPMKDGTSKVCKQTSSIVLKHASFRVLGVSEKEVIKVAE